MKTTDFQTIRARIRTLKAEADAKHKQIAAHDTQWQIELSNRGGEMTSSLTEEAQSAADRVSADLRASLAAVAKDSVPAIIAEHKRCVASVRDRYAPLAEEMLRLDVLERDASAILAALDAPRLPRFTDPDISMRAREFASRAAQLAAPPPAPRPKASALQRLDFSWLFGR